MMTECIPGNVSNFTVESPSINSSDNETSSLGRPLTPASSVSGKSTRQRRPRKQPLLSLGDRRVGTDLSGRDTSQRLLKVTGMSEMARRELYEKLSEELYDFVNNAASDWEAHEECRRFTIFGDCITCAHWTGRSIISGVDIIKTITAFYRLAHMGSSPTDRRKFEEGIISDLRNLKVGTEALLEEANSPLLQFLYRINSVRTHKRQKVFCWEAVPFVTLQREAFERERRSNRKPTDSLASARRKKLPLNTIPSIYANSPLRAMNNLAAASATQSVSSPSSGTGESSPRSWGSPNSDSANVEQGGFVVFLPTATGKNCNELISSDSHKPDEHLNIMRLAIVAEAALAQCEGKVEGRKSFILPSAEHNP